MATTDAAALHHSNVLPFLIKEVYGLQKGCIGFPPIEQMIADGAIAAETMYEMYEAKLCGGQKESGVGYDIFHFNEENEKVLREIKLRTLLTKSRSWGTERSAGLTANDTRCKIADIIMGVYNPHRDTLDRFLLPIGDGYTPGRTVTITYSLRGDHYSSNQQYLLSSTPMH